MAELQNTAPRIESTFRPDEADLVDRQKQKQKRRERKLKRMIVAGLGWFLIAWMVYLMIVTVRQTPKIWDPYEVLGISTVGVATVRVYVFSRTDMNSPHRRNRSSHITGSSR